MEIVRKVTNLSRACLLPFALYNRSVILLVEDDPESRYAVAHILRGNGYDVREAADGNEALALIQELLLQKLSIDLVITDLRMPNESGLVLAAHIHVKWPQVPMLLMSGYLSEPAGNLVSEGFAEFIQKPIDPAVLIATVQRLVQGRG
jgi:CheY-like chemotaxis protein